MGGSPRFRWIGSWHHGVHVSHANPSSWRASVVNEECGCESVTDVGQQPDAAARRQSSGQRRGDGGGRRFTTDAIIHRRFASSYRASSSPTARSFGRCGCERSSCAPNCLATWWWALREFTRDQLTIPSQSSRIRQSTSSVASAAPCGRLVRNLLNGPILMRLTRSIPYHPRL